MFDDENMICIKNKIIKYITDMACFFLSAKLAPGNLDL